MTENEAVKSLEYAKQIIGLPEQGKKWSANRETIAIDIAIKALEEIQQYQEIGTVEECREAIEMQKKKKPNLVTPCKSINYYQCPLCMELVSINENFCNNCGQALYWEE